MSTLKLDTNGDLAVENNALVLLDDIQEETRQSLLTKFRFFLGEWFLDERIGIPHYQKILVKNPNLSAIYDIFKETILSEEGVQDLVTLKLDLDESNRRLLVSFEAITIKGEVLEFAEYILAENA